MTYQQQQKENTNRFQHLSKKDQNKAKQMGYNNRGKENVVKSAKILDTFYTFTINVEPEVEEIEEEVTQPIREEIAFTYAPFKPVAKKKAKKKERRISWSF